METGGSGGWGRDKRVYIHTLRIYRLGVYTVMHKQTNAEVHVQHGSCWGSRWQQPGRGAQNAA